MLLAGVAGLVAGAMSMAAGEYVSVSSQSDTEQADLARERRELREQPEFELEELAQIYVARGLEVELAREVARQLMAKDALGVHARDELGISEISTARPVQAALASAATFSIGAAAPLALVVIAPIELAAADRRGRLIGLPCCAWGPRGSRRRRRGAQADYPRDFLGCSRHGLDHGHRCGFWEGRLGSRG